MNELVEQLAIKAKIQMCSHPRLQEFAELIIQECITAVNEMDTIKGATTYDNNLVISTKQHCVRAIESRFK